MVFRVPQLPLPRADVKGFLTDLRGALSDYLTDLARYSACPAWRAVAMDAQTLGDSAAEVLTVSVPKQPRALTVVLFMAQADAEVTGQMVRGTTSVYDEVSLGSGSISMMALEEPLDQDVIYKVNLTGPAELSRATLLVTELRG